MSNSENTSFQEKLSNGIMQIKNSNKVFVSANNSLHIYKLDQSEYKKLVKYKIKKHKKSDWQKVNNVNSQSKR